MPHPNTGVGDYRDSVLGKMIDYGYVGIASLCPYCKYGRIGRNSRNACRNCGVGTGAVPRYDYRGLGSADLEHALFAKPRGVGEFYGGDKSFEDLSRDDDFKGISFNIPGFAKRRPLLASCRLIARTSAPTPRQILASVDVFRTCS